MIIPVIGKNGNIGTAEVKRVGQGARDFSVTFSLKPGIVLDDKVKESLIRDLKTLAWDQEKEAALARAFAEPDWDEIGKSLS
jgi:hypothetical protein